MHAVPCFPNLPSYKTTQKTQNTTISIAILVAIRCISSSMVKQSAKEKLMRFGSKYEITETLGEGNFGKVKLARRVDDGLHFAVKILDRKRILDLKIVDQIIREIGTLKLLNHPNVVRLHEVSASKTKIYMVLEYVNGGELFQKISTEGRLTDIEGRRLFQQLIDAISYCHSKGVYHRDLKLENVLVDSKGNIKISDFGLSALPEQHRSDGLLHTTCGSPSYVAPEVLANRGYDGAMSDIWSCGVILYVLLVGYLPFDDRNRAVLYLKIHKGQFKLPRWISTGASKLIRRILDPNPKTRISIEEIKRNEWFKQDYIPAVPLDNDCMSFNDKSLALKEPHKLDDSGNKLPETLNAFQIIGMSPALDLSGFFVKESVAERNIRFTSSYSTKDLFEKLENIGANMGFRVQKADGKFKIIQQNRGSLSSGCLSAVAEVFNISASLHVVELRKVHGDSSLYKQLCLKLSEDLGVGD